MAENTLGRGTIELVADARAFQATMQNAKKSINDLGKGQADAAARSSRSIDAYIGKLQLQNATIGKSARETRIFSLAARGASDAQIAAADAALRFREQQERSVRSVVRLGAATIGLGIGFAAAGRGVVQLSDEYTKYTAQLRLATSSQAEYNRALEDVRNVATSAQQPIAGIGTLYARISNATRDLGIGQKGVSDITTTVALALKAQGATASESASAMLQLSQAFGAGALRGEEFNAVNEAAPRLIRLLAETLGEPVGRMKELATQGELTAEVLAAAFGPAAHADLQREAKEVRTISGAFTVLRNNVVEFVGAQAESSGAVRAISGAVEVLAKNIDLVAAAAIGLTATKLSAFLIESAIAAGQKVAALYAVVAATNAERAAITGATTATVANTAATITNTAAKSGLVTATVAATAATAGSGAAAGIAARALGLLGGPIGVITTLLGLGATAWSLWGSRAESAADQASGALRTSTAEMITDLDKQIKKLEARRTLAMTGAVGAQRAQAGGPQAERLGEILGEINRIQAQPGGLSREDQNRVRALAEEYTTLNDRLARAKALQDDITRAGQERGASRWIKEYATDIEKMNAELEKARKELGPAFTAELERRIRAKFAPKGKKTPVDRSQERADDQQLRLEIERIRRAGDAEVAEFERSQRILQARRSANLVQDGEYYAARRKFIEDTAKAQEDALQKEIALLQRQTFSGKNAAADRIENDRKISTAQADLAKVRADTVASITINSIQEKAANDRVRQSYLDAASAADAYIDAIRRRNDLEIAGIGRGNKFRDRASGEADIDSRFIERRQQLESELRRGDITKDVFDTYLATAAQAYQREVALYRDRNAKIDELQADWRNGAREALQNYLDDVANAAKTYEELFGRAIQKTEDFFTEFITTGKADLKSFISSINADITRAFVKERITGPLTEAIKSGGLLDGVFSIFGAKGLGDKSQGPFDAILKSLGVTPFNPNASVDVAGKAAGGAAFSASITAAGAAFNASTIAAGTTFSASTLTAGTAFNTSTIAAGSAFTAAVTAAGTAFASSVAAGSASSSAGSAAGGAFGSVLGSFDVGTPYVPRTGPYLLHQGERVLTAAENARGVSSQTFNVTVNAAQGMDRRTAAQMGVEFARSAQRELARATS